MNIWTDIAIGNLQRHRGPPLDMDIETGEIAPQELFACKGPCGIPKPASEFYFKHDKRYGRHFRQSTCKACILARDPRRNNSSALATNPRNMIMASLASPMTVKEIGTAIGFTRRPTQSAIVGLVADGLVRPAGFCTRGTNSRVPLYDKT